MCHRASKDTCNKLANEVFKAKKEHWQEWLEEATGDDIWMAHCYIKTPLAMAAEHGYLPSGARTAVGRTPQQ